MTRFTSSNPGSPKFDVKKRQLFLDELSESANVRAAARAADVSPSCVYRERRASEGFRAAWSAALAEGYARLETELLSEALIPVSGTVAEVTLRSRAQKYRLGMALLAAHLGSVKGAAPAVKPAKATTTARQRLEAKFSEMHSRMKAAKKVPVHDDQ
jgi:hypothetical protein